MMMTDKPTGLRTETIFSEFHSDGPGVAAGLFKEGEVVDAFCKGLASVTPKQFITPGTCFRVGCISNQFTGFAIGVLIDRGILRFDTAIRDFLPELPKYSEVIEVKHLLNQSSGLHDLRLTCRLIDADIETASPGALFEMIARQRFLYFQPGTRLMYSQSSFFLLSTLIERVSGLTYGEFCKREIFDRCGMTHSVAGAISDGAIAELAHGYEVVAGTPVRRFANQCTNDLVTNLVDLAKWHGLLESRFGTSITDLLYGAAGIVNLPVIKYSCGHWIKAYRGLTTHAQAGHAGGFNCGLCRFPTERVGFAVLSNHKRYHALAGALSLADEEFKDVMTSPPLHTSPAPGPAHQPPRLSKRNRLKGTYFNPDLNLCYDITTDQEFLVRSYEGRRQLFRPVDASRFRSIEDETETLTVNAEADGSLVVGFTGFRPEIRFRKIPGKRKHAYKRK